MQAGEIVYDVEIHTRELTRGEREATAALDNVDRGMQEVEKTSQRTERSMTGLARAIGAVVSAQALKAMAGLVQQHQAMAERVRMASSSMEEFEMVQQRLLETANGTYRELSEAQEVYIRTADSLRAMGYSTEQALDVSDALSYSFVTNATAADRAATATSAFSKAMNTGRVSADQWETITSAIPTVIENIADASDMSATEIRALGAAGKLSATQLSEGLRQARADIVDAADSMASDLTDAAVRSRTALTAVLVALEDQSGALQSLTDGIISASEAVLSFAGNGENMAALLDIISVAGASVASIFAGRLLSSMASSTTELYRATIGARAKAAADVQAAQAAAAQAAQALMQARAAEQAARGLSTHAAAAVALKSAEDAATAATARLTAAQNAQAGALRLTTAAANGLRTAMAFLGGPAGVVMIAASAILLLGNRARDASAMVELLTRETDDLTRAQRGLYQLQLSNELQAQQKQLERLYRVARTATGATMRELREGLVQLPVAAQAGIDDVLGNIDRLEKRLQQVGNMNIPRPGGAGGAPDVVDLSGSSGAEESEFQKLEKSLENQVALAKKAGVARKELAALQRLGADATDTERARISELVVELHDLEEAERAAKEASEKARRESEKSEQDRINSQKANEEAIKSLRLSLEDLTRSELDLIEVQALRTLNESATPEEIQEVKDLAAAIRALRQEEIDLEKAKKDAADAEKMRQDVIGADPRTAALDQYQQQLEAYRQYKEAELLTDLQYNELRAAAATEYEQARLAAQEEMFRAQSAGNAFVMDSLDALGQQGTSVISGLLSGTMNTREAMQALANTIFKQGVGALVELGLQHVKSMVMGQAAQAAAAATAAATGTAMAASYAPAAAMASLASYGANAIPAQAGIAATTALAQGLAVSGRQHGGPVDPSRMYRINEGGAPEVFNAANGMQYMMANTRGEVVSNADASKGAPAAGVNLTINLIEDAGRAGQVSQTSSDDQHVIDVVVASIHGDGDVASAFQQKYNLETVGR